MASGKNPLAAGASTPERQPRSMSVSEAVGAAKRQMKALPQMTVVGEVTGFRGPNARSGHCYFQVKDDAATMSVIVWRGVYAHAGVELRDGMQIQMVGGFDVYAGQGSLSFICTSVQLAGEGLLRQQVDALARKLQAEGLMDDARKRRIPRFCVRVAVVTSLSGSVIDDVKRTLRRRNPLVELDVVGCAVQGQHAPATIMRALEVAAAAAPEAILLVRGGGSFEDLMTFNDEALARAVAACPVPVITGIGHEPDTTICDMVADRRSSTPTAAAESVAPAIDEVVQVVEGRRQRMASALDAMVARESGQAEALAARATQAVSARLSRERALLDALAHRRCLEDPTTLVTDRLVSLVQTEERLHQAIPRALERDERELSRLSARLSSSAATLVRPFAQQTQAHGTALDAAAGSLLRPHAARLSELAATLEALSPLKVLARGYAIATTGAGHVVKDAHEVAVGDELTIRLGLGTVEASVTSRDFDSTDDAATAAQG